MIPAASLKVSEGRNLYDVTVAEARGKPLLVVSGEAGAATFDWEKIQAMLEGVSLPPAATVSLSVDPLQVFTPHPSVTEKLGVEVNCAAVDGASGKLIGAAGDLFGCYVWDVETGKFLHNLSSNKDFLHSVTCVPGSSNLLVLGGEDGTVDFWDFKERALVDRIDSKVAMTKSSSSSVHCWTSSTSADAGGNFLAACGGAEGSWSDQNGLRGWVAYLHVSTRTLTSSAQTAVENNKIIASKAGWLTVGDEPVVNFWSCTKAQQVARPKSTSSSSFGVYSMNDGVVVTGGSSNTIDVFVDRNLTFSLKCVV